MEEDRSSVRKRGKGRSTGRRVESGKWGENRRGRKIRRKGEEKWRRREGERKQQSSLYLIT